MKRFSGTISLLFAAMAVFILGGSVRAAAQETLKITIPFDFTANHQYLPAGAYNVIWLSDRNMVLRNSETGKSKILAVRPEEGQSSETRSRFVFLHEGSRYYLARVWVAGTSLHSEMVTQHRPERGQQVAMLSAPATVEINAN